MNYTRETATQEPELGTELQLKTELCDSVVRASRQMTAAARARCLIRLQAQMQNVCVFAYVNSARAYKYKCRNNFALVLPQRRKT